MDETLLHKLAGEVGGRFRLTVMVQKRLLDLMREGSEVIKKGCGGRPVRLVVESLAKEILGLPGPEEAAAAPEKVAAPAGKKAE